MPSELTLWQLYARNLADPTRPALITGRGEVWTYGALAVRAEAAAGGLAARGVEAGDRVVVHLPRGVDEVVALLAALRLGAVVAGIHPLVPEPGLRRAIQGLRPAAVVTTGVRAAALAAHTEPGVRVVVAVDPVPGQPDIPALSELSGPVQRCPARADELAALFTTSGSTGGPKAALHTHAGLAACGRDVAEYLRYGADERLLGLLPLSSHYGFSQLTSAWASGGAVVLPESVLPADVLDTVARLGVTGMAGVPVSWHQWLAVLEDHPRPLPSLRFVTNAGGGLDGAVCDRLQRQLPGVRIHLLYGLTEALRSTHLPPELRAQFPGAMGRPVRGVELFVADGDRLCGVDEVGELVHRGPTVALGYWGAAAATAATFRPPPACVPPTEERVCWSGDLVRRDSHGVYWFVSRADWLIKTSGFRVGPSEVEEAVVGSGVVALALVFGAPDPVFGQVVEVVVTTRDDSPLDTDALRRHCRAVLPAYMVPRRFHHWRGPLPLTPAGKPARAAVVAACLAGALPVTPPGVPPGPPSEEP